LVLKNNILSNDAGGYTIYCGHSGVISSSDYNDLYTKGNSSTFAYLNSSSYSSLTEWQATGLDAHSYQLNPQFFSDTDLHLNQPALNGKGAPISGYGTDIDGETRNTSTPDIGADEREGFTDLTDIGINALLSPSVDGGLSESSSVQVRIENMGSVSVSGINVGYILNSESAVIESIGSTTLDPGERMDYTFTTIPTGLAALKSLTITTFTILSGDENSTDDTLTTTLEWLPDLQITDLTIAESFYLNQSIELTWTVTNNGNGSTSADSWEDHVWLSSDEDLRQTDDVLLTTAENLSYLHAGQSYVQSITVDIPDDITAGTFMIFITSDMYDAYCVGGDCYDGVDRDSHGHSNCNVLDEIYNDNNYAFDTLSFQNPSAPDLTVTSIGMPTSAYSGDSISLTYSVQNSGEANVSSQSWTDDIYISSSSVFDESTAMLIGSVSNSSDLSVNASYANSINVKIPEAIYDNYYIYVYCNKDESISEYENTYSNISAGNAINILLTPPANLVPTALSCASTANSGEDISVSWTVANNGANAPYELLWNDKIYISTSSSFDTNNATLLGTYYKYDGTLLSVGSSYTATESYTLPNGIAGVYYIYVVADDENMVFEYNSDNDNTIKSSAVTISLSASPDLTITSATTDAIVYAGYSAFLSWDVKNQGSASASTWINGIYISDDDVLDADDELLDTIVSSSSLAAGQTTTVSAGITFEDLGLNGSYYIIINVDDDDAIYEYNAESNNTTSKAITMSWKYADLNVSSFTAPSSANSGEEISASWQVQNIGGGFTYEDFWSDYVYLSTDNVYDANDSKLKTSYRHGILESADTYSQSSISIDIPNGISGSYYLIFATDATQTVDNETATSNNYLAQAISINATTPSDLIVSSTTVPSSFYAGEQISISYTITNQGAGVTESSSWYAGIYISNTTDLSDYYKKLDQDKASTILNSGESYSGSMNVSIPSYLSGNYYMIVMADCNDNLYEGSYEGNNINADLRNLLVADPSDLIVTAISLPSSITLGNTASVSYTIKNNSTTASAIGDLRDIAYLSSNISLDASADKMINYKDQTISLAAGSSATYTLEGQVTDITPGSYYGILSTNTLNSISESNTSNNSLTTSSTSTIGVNALTLGTASSSNLELDYAIYYKADLSANKDLQITLTSNQSEGYNEIYVAYNRIPSETDYDYMQEEDGKNPEVLVPSTQAGTYYMMIKTLSMFSSTQTVSVLAQELSFQILSIDPGTVGQGVVTCTLKGAGFRTGMQVYLKSGSTTVATAEVREETSSMEYRIRWSLASVALGIYDVVAVNTDNSSTSLINGLTIEPAEDYNISFKKYSPDDIRLGSSAFYTYEITNASNIDIPYFIGYFTVDAGVEISNTKINGIDYQSSWIDPTTQLSKYWVDIDGLRFIPIHLRDLQPNEEVDVEFIFSGFDSDMETFTINFLYTTQDAAFYIQDALLEADNTRTAILNQASYLTDELGSDIINKISDQTAFREIYMKTLFYEGLLSEEDFLNAGYTSTYAAVTSIKQTNSTIALGEDCYENEGERLSEIIAAEIAAFNNSMAFILEDYIFGSLTGDGASIIIGLATYDNNSDLIQNTSDAEMAIIEAWGYGTPLMQEGIEQYGNIGTATEIVNLANELYKMKKVNDEVEKMNNKPLCPDEEDDDDNNGQPSDPEPTGGNNDECPLGQSCDPNEITGPSGIGKKQWVSVNDNLNYTIYFENDSSATAPAQEIVIAQTLDAQVDIYSIELGNFGFANMNFSVPANSITYSTTLELEDTLGVDVNVTAGLDIVNNQILWTFQAIDPATGKAPIDADKGMLFPNDSTGVGQGFVSYTINPSSPCNTGDSINATAEIIFDVNEPVVTNTHFNMVDAYAPVTTMAALNSSYSSPAFTLSWSSSDDAGSGSGVESYDVYVSHNGEAFELYTENTTANSVDYIGDATDVNLSFYVIAIDSVGNQEEKSLADVSTTIGSGSVTITSPNGGESYCASASVTITWSSTNVTDINIYYSDNGGSSYTSIASNVAGNTYNWTLPSTAGSYLVKIASASSSSIYDVSDASFTINALPTASITSSTGSATTFCTSATLTASSATSYSWSTGATTSSIGITTSGTYTVTITNAYGCAASAGTTMTKSSTPTANFTYSTSALTATFTNTSTNATSYSWTFGDGGTSTATSPSHTYASAATYSVKLTATNSCGSKSRTKSVTLSSAKTAIEEVNSGDLDGDKILWLYPNPAIDIANIDIHIEGQESDVEINIINLNGQIVQTIYTGKLDNGSHNLFWNTNKFSNGIYFVRTRIDDTIYQKQLSVIRK
jgi:PKD repeat protein